ncbi:MAG: PspC domain-containing protein [Clostridia bacterium]|nr:PspC domain-containing protein [Clostridia bacterium]
MTGRLHKSTKDKKVAGVCGGIAEYLKVDSSIIRLVFMLMCFGWGTGLLAYIVSAIIFPVGDDTEEDEEEEEKETTETEEEYYPQNENRNTF